MLTPALIGDVMLGRGVKDALKTMHPNDVWGNVFPHLMQTDLHIVNLEYALTTHNRTWSRNWMFHFRADPDAVGVLQDAHIDVCTLANNQILDFEEQGLFDILHTLKVCQNPSFRCRHQPPGNLAAKNDTDALARGEDFKAISAHIEILCAEFGNRLMRLDNRPVYEVSHAVG